MGRPPGARSGLETAGCQHHRAHRPRQATAYRHGQVRAHQGRQGQDHQPVAQARPLQQSPQEGEAHRAAARMLRHVSVPASRGSFRASLDSRASLGARPSDLGSSFVELDRRSSLGSRPVDITLGPDKRPRSLKGAYGRKPVPEASNNSGEGSPVRKKQQRAPLKIKARAPEKPKAPAPAPPAQAAPAKPRTPAPAAPSRPKSPAPAPPAKPKTPAPAPPSKPKTAAPSPPSKPKTAAPAPPSSRPQAPAPVPPSKSRPVAPRRRQLRWSSLPQLCRL